MNKHPRRGLLARTLLLLSLVAPWAATFAQETSADYPIKPGDYAVLSHAHPGAPLRNSPYGTTTTSPGSSTTFCSRFSPSSTSS